MNLTEEQMMSLVIAAKVHGESAVQLLRRIQEIVGNDSRTVMHAIDFLIEEFGDPEKP